MKTDTQNTTRHTPGPWVVQKPGGPQLSADRKFEIVAKQAGGGEQVIVGEHTGIDCLTKANAKLIAAAPELLEALEALFKECAMIHRYGGEIYNQKQANEAIKAGLAAIAKAKGE